MSSDHEDSSLEDLASPPSIDPYQVLSLERDATPDQIKSAYRKSALKHHPDKVPEAAKADAHTAFQRIAFAYGILSDPARRARYDATGSTDDAVDGDSFDWASFYRAQFADAVDGAAIAAFAARYRGSDEEAADVLAAYAACAGDLDGLYERVMLSDPAADEARFRALVDAAIADGRAEAFPAYAAETRASRRRRVARARAEAVEAEEYARELGVHDKLFGGGGGTGQDGPQGEGEKVKGKRAVIKGGSKKGKRGGDEMDLAALIQANHRKRAGFLDALEEKYAGGGGGGKKGSTKGKRKAEPTEEEFEAAAARLRQGKGESKGGSSGGRPAKKARR